MLNLKNVIFVLYQLHDLINMVAVQALPSLLWYQPYWLFIDTFYTTTFKKNTTSFIFWTM